ncbi:MAG TPA: VOC family protein [Gaiellaceae bacterium]|nr:VOC family protein [Gaiellaceae bacterium]
MTELYPFLAVRDVPAAIDFYTAAFGAVEVGERVVAPNGAMVAEIEIDGNRVGLASEAPDLGTPSPESAGATTVRLSLVVDDPDAVAARAVDAGARFMFPIEDQPYGWRQGRVVDPFGHHWLVGRPL